MSNGATSPRNTLTAGLGTSNRNGDNKAGKEEIVGLLMALQLFIAEGDAARHARWLTACKTIAANLSGVDARITGESDQGAVPTVEEALGPEHITATELTLKLQRGTPAIAIDPFARDRNIVIINPMCLKTGEAGIVGREIMRALS